tara:strand:- start:8359 stop:8553 length:195 start_codon:yes stop_codon:yes gene_type:complete
MANKSEIIKEDFTIEIAKSVLEEYEDESGNPLPALPFRLAFLGAPNLRLQSIAQPYKTFLGEQG